MRPTSPRNHFVNALLFIAIGVAPAYGAPLTGRGMAPGGPQASAPVIAVGGASVLSALGRGAAAVLRALGLPLPVRSDSRRVISREQGRQVLDYSIRDRGVGLYVQVSGQVEFERALIGFGDGTVENVDAFGLDRDSGLYELKSFEQARAVEWVKLVLVARSSRARVGICLGL